MTPAEYHDGTKHRFDAFYGIGPNGNLWVEGCDVKDLADRFGAQILITNAYILGKGTLREAVLREGSVHLCSC